LKHPTNPSLLLVISAPSGGGKTTVCENLLASRPNLHRAVTCTTRAPRPGEVDGVDYHFLEPDSFLKRVQAGNFLEHATVFGNSYGILKSELLDALRQDTDVLLSVDVQGAATIRSKAADHPELRHSIVTVFLAPPSIRELERRLRKRNKDSEATIQKRLGVARQEIAHARHFDYLVISGEADADLARLTTILDAEKMRQARVALPPYDVSQLQTPVTPTPL
jgi:guanylate kinase